MISHGCNKKGSSLLADRNFYIILFFFPAFSPDLRICWNLFYCSLGFAFSVAWFLIFRDISFCHCNVVSLFSKLTVQHTSLPTISSDIKSNGPEQFSHCGKGIIKFLLYKVFRKWQDINGCLNMCFVLWKKTWDLWWHKENFNKTSNESTQSTEKWETKLKCMNFYSWYWEFKGTEKQV